MRSIGEGAGRGGAVGGVVGGRGSVIRAALEDAESEGIVALDPITGAEAEGEGTTVEPDNSTSIADWSTPASAPSESSTSACLSFSLRCCVLLELELGHDRTIPAPASARVAEATTLKHQSNPQAVHPIFILILCYSVVQCGVVLSYIANRISYIVSDGSYQSFVVEVQVLKIGEGDDDQG